jgi:hypothetical protein
MAAEIIAVVEIIIKVVGTNMAAPDHVGTLIKGGNLDEFTRELIPYCERNFRQLALFLTNNEYFIPAEIDPPDEAFDNDIPEQYAQRLAFEQRVKNRENLIGKLGSDCIPIFSVIWN